MDQILKFRTEKINDKIVHSQTFHVYKIFIATLKCLLKILFWEFRFDKPLVCLVFVSSEKNSVTKVELVLQFSLRVNLSEFVARFMPKTCQKLFN
jgi:hypothetical protein